MNIQCKRVNIGGKLLTNYLKEVVSYRQWNMMDEFKIIDQVRNYDFSTLFTAINIQYYTRCFCSGLNRDFFPL